MDAIETAPSGIRLSAWVAQAPISRATAYQLIRLLGITPGKAAAPGSRVPVSYLSADDQARMDAAAARIAGGTPISALATALAPRSAPDESADDQETTGQPPGPELLLARLEAIERAVHTGAPLTTPEVEWMLGARPGASVVTRGRLTATRHIRNVWSLSTDAP
jgi:hypothetical protein